MTEVPATTTFTSIVSRATVRIALMITAINDLEVNFCDCDICTCLSQRKGVD